jgi:hypothetical protein
MEPQGRCAGFSTGSYKDFPLRQGPEGCPLRRRRSVVLPSCKAVFIFVNIPDNSRVERSAPALRKTANLQTAFLHLDAVRAQIRTAQQGSIHISSSPLKGLTETSSSLAADGLTNGCISERTFSGSA